MEVVNYELGRLLREVMMGVDVNFGDRKIPVLSTY
jgi:hypothetical protein